MLLCFCALARKFRVSMWAWLVFHNTQQEKHRVNEACVEMDGTSSRIRPGQDRHHTLDPAALLATFFMAPIHLLWDHDRTESTLQLHTLLAQLHDTHHLHHTSNNHTTRYCRPPDRTDRHSCSAMLKAGARVHGLNARHPQSRAHTKAPSRSESPCLSLSRICSRVFLLGAQIFRDSSSLK